MLSQMSRPLFIGLSCLLISSCGSATAPEPVEQIIVSEPGAEKLAANSDGGTNTQDLAAAGEAAFAICTGCHVVESGAASTVGPNLHNVLGRKAGSVEGYTYSEALAGSDIVWSEAELDAFIADPQGKIAGTNMVAGAVSDADSRAAIIAYLAAQSN